MFDDPFRPGSVGGWEGEERDSGVGSIHTCGGGTEARVRLVTVARPCLGKVWLGSQAGEVVDE